MIDTATNRVALELTIGGRLRWIGTIPLQVAPFAYVSNVDSETVSVLDVATNRIVTTVTVGKEPFQAAITPDGKQAYVPNVGSHTISVIDTDTNTAAAPIPLELTSGPAKIAINPDGRHVYLAGRGKNQESTLLVLDTATKTVVATIPGVEGQIAITPDGKRIYVANGGGSDSDLKITVIDAAANTVSANVELGKRLAFAIAITPDGKYVYVASGDIFVLDTATNMVVATIPARDGFGAGDIAFTPDGKFAYVVNCQTFAVLVVDTVTKTVVARVILAEGPEGIAVAADGKHAYATGGKSISVLDTSTNTVATTVPLETRGFAIAIIPLPPITR